MEKHLSRSARGLAICAVTVVLVVAMVPMYFAHPLADDWGRWQQGAEKGFFTVAYENYFQWTGRWSAMAVAGGVLPRLEGHRYGVALAVLAVLQLVACYAFLRLALSNTVSRSVALGLACCLYAVYWAGMPKPGETVYWISGGLEYQLSISLATILVWMTATVNARGYIYRAGWITGLSLLLLFITGLHELTALFLVIVLAVAAAISHRTRSEHFSIWCCLLAVALAGFLFNVLAPGNAVRSVHFPHARHIGRTIGITAKFLLRDVSIWIADPRLLAASLFLFLSPWFARLRPAWLTRSEVPWKWILPGCGVCFLALGAAAPGFATACSPPDRAGNLLHFVFLMSWFATLLALSRWPDNWILRREPPAPLLQTTALAVLGLSLLASGNTNLALRDFDKRINRWHKAVLERDELARSAAAGSHVVVPELPQVPSVYFSNDICTNPDDWRNCLFARFHGLASVRHETELDRLQRQAAANQNSPTNAAVSR